MRCAPRKRRTPGQKSIEHFTGIFEGCSTIEDQLIKGPKSLGRNVATYDPARAQDLHRAHGEESDLAGSDAGLGARSMARR